jgi:hypothetical protein
MGILLALAGLAVGGGIIQAIGGKQEAGYKARQAELEAQKKRESIQVLQSQLQAMQEESRAGKEQLTLRERSLGLAGIQTAEEGAVSVGSARAETGVSNLGGVSSLRKANMIQRQTDRQMAEIGVQRSEAQLSYQQLTRDIGARSLATQYDIRWAGIEAQNLEEQAQFYRSYGLLSGIGSILGAGAGALSLFR